MMKNGNQRGFTLIEMMIAIVIIAVLASIAYPSYLGSVKKSRRVEAQTALQQIATLEEQLNSETGGYTADLTELGFPSSNWNTTENKYYQFRVLPPNNACPIDRCFKLRAKPANEQASDKWEFRLDSNGRKYRREGFSGAWTAGWQI